jgi:uncharacterized protein (TIGR03435 family)
VRAIVIALVLLTVAAQARPAFEVASVKQNSERAQGRLRYSPMGVDFSDVSLSWIIGEAYNVPYSRISNSDGRSNDLFEGRMLFDISARAGNEAPKEQIRLMLQMLLADRFKLTVHKESRSESVYKVVVAKNGPKFQESKNTDGEPSVVIGPRGFVFRNTEMPRFAGVLSMYQDRPVIDRTGLTGVYDFTLSAPEQLQATVEAKRSFMEWLTSSMFADIQRQLGLQLVSDKASVDYIVVDHVEKPSEN